MDKKKPKKTVSNTQKTIALNSLQFLKYAHIHKHKPHAYIYVMKRK